MSRSVSKTRCVGRHCLAVFAGFLAFASANAGARAEGLKDSAEQAAKSPRRADDEQCRRYGPGYSAVGESGLCAYVGGGVLIQAAKEFTDRDIFLTGQRIPTLFAGGAGVPMVYYHVDDVSKQTKYPAIGAIASAHMMVRGESDLGLIRGFVRVTADARTYYQQDDGSVSVDLRQIDDSYYLGALEEAWVQWDGLKVGIQPSLFGFNRLPSVVTPGYTSIVTTLGASYTHVITPNMSVSLGAEDSGRRLMGEGVLARPSRSDTPDVVALFRMATPSTLFHLSGAVHHAEDHVVSDFDAGPTKRVAGWAWSAGLQSRVKWDDLLGSAGQGQLGRLGLTVANASGALGYLGVPFFSPDYVVGSDGAVNRSHGWSALASYEHMLAPRMKLTLNASLFDLTMHSSPEEVIPHLDPDVAALPELEFEVDVRGTVLQAGIEYMLTTSMVVGVEGGYTTTEAQGRYIGMPGGKLSVGFPHVGLYLRQSF